MVGSREGRSEKRGGGGEDGHLAGDVRGKDSNLALALVGGVCVGVFG